RRPLPPRIATKELTASFHEIRPGDHPPPIPDPTGPLLEPASSPRGRLPFFQATFGATFFSLLTQVIRRVRSRPRRDRTPPGILIKVRGVRDQYPDAPFLNSGRSFGATPEFKCR